MNANITDPARGGDILQWAQGVTETCRRFGGVGSANLLMREGSGGIGYEALPENRRERRAADALHPWKVFAFAQNEDRDHCFEIHVPEGSLHVGEDAPEVGDLTPVEGQSGRYTLDCEDEISGEAVIYLAVIREAEDETEDGEADGDAETPGWTARVVSTPEAVEDAEEVLAILPIARLSIDDSGDYAVGRVVEQYAHSSVALGDTSPAAPDKGCYAIALDPDIGEKYFANQYYLSGNMIVQTNSAMMVSDFVGAESAADDRPFVCLDADAEDECLVGFASVAELAAEQKTHRVIPLYKFTHEGEVEIDFRNAPRTQNFETELYQ